MSKRSLGIEGQANMGRFKLIATNLLTAIVTTLVVSSFWIIAYSNGSNGAERGGKNAENTMLAGGADERLVLGPTGVAIPVAGIQAAQLNDTFKQARAGGSRVHDAIDIMAPHGTLVIAAAPGVVEKLYFSRGGGGITAYVRSEDGNWIYYYAHLRDYAPGLREGQRLRRGDAIGSVGSTGNAGPSGPHLHFAIHRLAAGQRWHEGAAINPYPLLVT